MTFVLTKVESSLLQIDPALCWNFSQTILNFFFWHPLFWLVLFHVVCHCLIFCFENAWEKFHLWAGSIWSKPDSTLVTIIHTNLVNQRSFRGIFPIFFKVHYSSKWVLENEEIKACNCWLGPQYYYTLSYNARSMAILTRARAKPPKEKQKRAHVIRLLVQLNAHILSLTTLTWVFKVISAKVARESWVSPLGKQEKNDVF